MLGIARDEIVGAWPLVCLAEALSELTIEHWIDSFYNYNKNSRNHEARFCFGNIVLSVSREVKSVLQVLNLSMIFI